jgi:ADP-ribose pyrophosphatase YjhB (NUDIX family)
MAKTPLAKPSFPRSGRRVASRPPASHPLLTIAIVTLTLREDGLGTLLIRRDETPYAGRWALPRGVIRPDDMSLAGAARRLLAQAVGVEASHIEQLETFGDTKHDPRGWAVTVAYMALLPADRLGAVRMHAPDKASWWPVVGTSVAPNLAFDHAHILTAAIARLRARAGYTSLPIHLLPQKFTLPDLQRVHEQLLGRSLDKSAFRKRITGLEFLEPVVGERRPASNRPAQLWRAKADHRTVFFDRLL